MKRRRKRKTNKADHLLKGDLQVQVRKKIFYHLSSLPETHKGSHPKKRRKLQKTAKTLALSSSKIFR